MEWTGLNGKMNWKGEKWNLNQGEKWKMEWSTNQKLNINGEWEKFK